MFLPSKEWVIPTPKATGDHFDTGKPRMDLLPVGGLFAVADVMGYGAGKYGARNWQGGIAYSKLVASTLRHLFRRLGGQVLDDESGLPHLAHAAANLLMVLDTDPRLDDLPRDDLEPSQGKLPL